MTTDKDGRILIAGSVFGEVDPQTGVFTEFGLLPDIFEARGDMTFYKGRLLLTARTTSPLTEVLIEVDLEFPSASIILTELVFPGDTLGRPHGLVTLLDNCENQRVIIVGSYQNLYELNMEDYNVIPLCEPPHGFTGAALLTEYLASACDLLLDLDFDNSSGAMGFDWQDSIRCMPYDSPLCDEDVYVHAEARIDSLTVWLEGTPPDGDKEHLWFGGYPGLGASVSSGPAITLVNEGDITHVDWEQAILSLRYRHDGPVYTPGPRQVAFLLHSAIRAGDTVRATLYVPDGMPWAGRDTVTYRCKDAGNVALADLLSPDAMSSGSFSTPDIWWQPGLSADTTLVSYVVSHPECSADTAWLTLIALEVPEVDLGPDHSLCYGDEWLITVEDAATYLWQDGSTSDSYLVTAPGTYQVTATHSNGCTADDTVEVVASPLIVLPDILASAPLCPDEEEGTITLGVVSGGQPPLLIRIDGEPVPDETTLTGYPAGDYVLDIVDALGCMKSALITVPVAPGYELIVPAEVLINAGAEAIITVAGTLPQPVHYTWSPSSLIAGQEGNRVGITASESGLLTLHVTDAHGCMYEAVIHIIVQDNIELYVPTAFSPNGDGINDVWMPVPGGGKSWYVSDMRFFDRWGNLLFATAGPAGGTGWDGKAHGKLCDPGVYVYQFIIEGKVFSGEVQLLR